MSRPLLTFLYKLPQFLAIALDFSISYCTFVNKICSRTMPIKRKSRWQQRSFQAQGTHQKPWQWRRSQGSQWEGWWQSRSQAVRACRQRKSLDPEYNLGWPRLKKTKIFVSVKISSLDSPQCCAHPPVVLCPLCWTAGTKKCPFYDQTIISNKEQDQQQIIKKVKLLHTWSSTSSRVVFDVEKGGGC